MKKQITEVQNYFIDKITNCEFDSYEIKDTLDGWFSLTVKIDGFEFDFAVHPKKGLRTDTFGFMTVKIPNSRLKNLIELINSIEVKIKAAKIEKLKAELAELEPQA